MFHDIQLNDYWLNAVGDYVTQTSAFNGAQSARCADGRIVYVLSIRDPGVHNWLDPVGLHELLLVHRWQRLPTQPASSDRRPAISGGLVKFAALDSMLDGVARVDKAARAAQLAERLATYQLRLHDH